MERAMATRARIAALRSIWRLDAASPTPAGWDGNATEGIHPTRPSRKTVTSWSHALCDAAWRLWTINQTFPRCSGPSRTHGRHCRPKSRLASHRTYATSTTCSARTLPTWLCVHRRCGRVSRHRSREA